LAQLELERIPRLHQLSLQRLRAGLLGTVKQKKGAYPILCIPRYDYSNPNATKITFTTIIIMFQLK